MDPSELGVESFLGVGRYAVFQSDARLKDGPRFPTSILGWKKGRSVLIEHPETPEGRDAAIRDGQACVVRFVHEGNACAFTSIVLARIGARSDAQVSLSWPERIEAHPLRRHERIRFETPCRIDRASGEMCEAYLKDISMGGCGLVTKAAILKEETLELKFALTDGVDISGLKVIARMISEKPGGRFVGCEFEAGQERAKNRVSLFVTSEISRGRAGAVPTTSARRVMLVDPRPEVFEETHGTLCAHGVEVYNVTTVVDAIVAFRASPFQVIAIHQDLPDLPGIELCRLLQGASNADGPQFYLYGGKQSTPEALLKVRPNRWISESPSTIADLSTELLRAFDAEPPANGNGNGNGSANETANETADSGMILKAS